MPNRFLFLLTVLAAISPACTSTDSQKLWARVVDKNEKRAEEWANHDEGEYELRILVPYGWETYNTDDGIVLNEMVGANAPDTPLHGILIHVFVPDAQQFRWPKADDDVNLAWYILKQVVHNPDYVGSALISEPVAFDWDHHDAAYYLLNNRDGTVTMLLAMGMPDGRSLVVSHISVPEDQAYRVRRYLPTLLATLTIDGQPIDVAALDTLPDPLVFPGE
jgi:hypothetical protein